MARPARLLVWATASLLTITSAACTRDGQVDPPQTGPDTSSAPRVVVISIDGLRPDAIAAANAPTLQRLIREGAASLTAQSVLPSATLPSHVSMLTGLLPARHGIVWNDDITTQSTPLEVPTVFDVTSDAALSSAMFVGKSKLSILVHPRAPSRLSIPNIGETWSTDQVARQVLTYVSVAKPRPSLLFIHLPDVDLKGHEFGWMSAEYLAAVRQTDNSVAQIWLGLKQAFGANLILIITADHGGVDHNHHDGSLQSTTIPWIVWGRGVKQQTLEGPVRILDTAPTVLWLLKLPVPAGWDGAAVTSAFQLAPAG